VGSNPTPSVATEKRPLSVRMPYEGLAPALPAARNSRVGEIHEFISFRFKPEVTAEVREQTMAELGPVVAGCEGFVRREFYYSERDERWMSHVVWESEEAIDASAAVDSDPAVAELYERFDAASVDYARYRREG
jgi:heme-degrading monooxygenase HmoA